MYYVVHVRHDLERSLGKLFVLMEYQRYARFTARNEEDFHLPPKTS